jgi:hypothetical protein
LELEADFYLIGIGASIKEGNPDMDIIKESEMIASNDPAIMLRSLMIDIHDFELNRLNDINQVFCTESYLGELPNIFSICTKGRLSMVMV